MLAARTSTWRLLLAGRAGVLAQQSARGERRQFARASAAAAFHSSGPQEAAPPPPPHVGRPSKTAAKQEAKEYQTIARTLTRLTDRQVARLLPLVGEEVVDAVGVAARISHRNQGRQRQEALVAKLLRESVQGTDVAQLQAAIESVKGGQGVISNPLVEQQLQLWLDALLGGDSQAATQVFGLAQGSGIDLQQLRQLLRQAQQTEAVAPAATAAESSSGEGAAAAATAAGTAGSAGGTSLRPTRQALKARKQLRGLLQPVAQAQVGADSEEDE